LDERKSLWRWTMARVLIPNKRQGGEQTWANTEQKKKWAKTIYCSLRKLREVN